MMNILNALCIVAAIVVSANGFMTPTPLSSQTVSRSTTTLNMVADNAKVVLVTGSSRGLGKAIALEIGASGHKLVINYVSDSSKDSAEATVEEIKKSGGDAVAIQADSEYSFELVQHFIVD
jgi:UDP-N-acetylglucosamine:LPS N-acetylglucosamine transferase